MKGTHVVARAEPELEDVAPLDEERALLGEKQREAREIRAPGVDVRLSEVGVDRQ